MIALMRKRKSRLASVNAHVITSTPASGSVCAAERITPNEIKSLPQRPSRYELIENPLYYDKDYKGLHRWEVA